MSRAKSPNKTDHAMKRAWSSWSTVPQKGVRIQWKYVLFVCTFLFAFGKVCESKCQRPTVISHQLPFLVESYIKRRTLNRLSLLCTLVPLYTWPKNIAMQGLISIVSQTHNWLLDSRALKSFFFTNLNVYIKLALLQYELSSTLMPYCHHVQHSVQVGGG